MAISAANRTKILQLVVGMFHAAPGAEYLNLMAQAFEAFPGTDAQKLQQLAVNLAPIAISTEVYPAFMDGQMFAAAFLTPFGLQGNVAVRDYLAARYDAHTNIGIIINDAIAALAAATDPAFTAAKEILENKVAVAAHYSVTLGLSDPDLADLQVVLAGVTDDASAAAAIAALNGEAAEGTTFTLKHELDHVNGTALNDTITGIVDGEFAENNTFTLGDDINGGDGDDLLTLLTDQLNVNFLGKTITSVEAFELDVVNGTDFDLLNLNNNAFATVVVDFNGADELDGMTINKIDTGTDLTVANLELGGQTLDANFNGAADSTVSLDDVDGGTVDLNFVQTKATGSLTLNLDSVDDAYVAIGGNGVLTLNINVNGDSDSVGFGNNSGFADDSASVVNLVLNADFHATGWDLADNDEGTTTTFNISGSGDFTSDTMDDYGSELTIAGATATGDLDITVTTNTAVSATTGSGDDRLAFNIGYFAADGELVVDLGTGANTLAVNNEGSFSASDINGLLFSDTTISNAQTLELNGDLFLSEGALLDVEGIGGLAAVHVVGGIEGEGSTLSFPGAVEDDPETDEDETNGGSPATLALNVDGAINDLGLNTGDIANMTVTADGELDLDSVTSEVLETLTLVDTDDEGQVWLDLDGADGNLAALTTLDVTGEGNVDIDVAGDAGSDSVAATDDVITPATIESAVFSVDTTGTGGNKFVGTVRVSSSSLVGGFVDVAIAGGNNNSTTQVADAIAFAINAAAGVTSDNSGSAVSATWDTGGARGDFSLSIQTTTSGNAPTFTTVLTNQGANQIVVPGTPAIPATDASGFEALTDVMVDAGGDANLSMADAFGGFAVDVTAGGSAGVNLENTGVTSIAIDAGDYAGLFVDTAADLTTVVMSGINVQAVIIDAGVTSIVATADATEDDMGDATVVAVETADLASVTVTGWTSYVELDGAQDSFATLDISNVVDAAVVDVDDADFEGTVTVLVGESDVVYVTEEFNAEREVFDFVGDNTGDVSITGFFLSVGGTGDRLDFSDMAGIDAIDDLEIVLDGSDTVITSLVDGVDVSITVVGVDLTTDAYHFVF